MITGLVGFPVEHSLSPLIHQVFMDHFGISGEYRLLSVPPEMFKEKAGSLAAEGFTGVNVTVPHKKAAAGFCSSLSSEASAAGAVNTVMFSREGPEGYNTDVEGFRLLAIDFPRPLLVVGTGGAAAAVRASEGGDAVFLNGRIASLPEDLPSCGTVVNATPLGWSDDDPFPIRPPSGWAFIDLNYNPHWRWRNSLNGVRLVTGEKMLVEQAACSFRIWTGRMPGPDVKREALERIRSTFI